LLVLVEELPPLELTLAPFAFDAVVFAPELVVPAPPLLVVLTAVAAVALPVIVPGPWLPVGVKYKLIAVWLGYMSLMTVAPETLLVPSLKLEKICAKPAVGVPVQRRFEADVMMRLKAFTSCWERAPCTVGED
jgi:hypothetical protein